MKRKSGLWLVLGSFLIHSIMAPLSLAVEDPTISGPTCYYKFKDEKTSTLLMTGIVLLPIVATPFVPFLILLDFLAVPTAVWGGIHAYKMDTMIDLLAQVHAGSGKLLDEFVSDVQSVVPDRTRDQILSVLLLADKNLILCPSGGDVFMSKYYTYSMTVKLGQSPTTDLNPLLQPALSQNLDRNISDTSGVAQAVVAEPTAAADDIF